MLTIPWYHRLEQLIEPSYPLMLAIAAFIIIVTVVLVVKGDPVILAAWLVYLLSP